MNDQTTEHHLDGLTVAQGESRDKLSSQSGG